MHRDPGAGSRGYAICGTPRSGSTLLCQLLASTGVLGLPEEYLNQRHPARRWGVPDVASLGRTPNGVYGFSVFPDHLDRIRGSRWLSSLPGLVFVQLARTDLLGQAISWARAEQTQQWYAWQPAVAAPVYDRAHIDRLLRRLAQDQARWAEFFARNELPVVGLTYDRVVADPSAAVKAVAEALGVTTPVQLDPAKVAVTVQRDELSSSWRTRFLEESRDLTAFPPRCGRGKDLLPERWAPLWDRAAGNPRG